MKINKHNKVHPSDRDSIREVEAYIRKAETVINKLQIHPRNANRHPFDIVALATLSKGFALSKACIKLLKANLPDEAYGMSRSLIECSTILRHLTVEPESKDNRTRDFAKYSLADKAYWLHHGLLVFAGKPEEHEMREYAKKLGIVPDTKPVSRHWSGTRQGFVWKTTTLDHPLDGAITSVQKNLAFAAEYHHTSDYVHCAVPATDSYCPEEKIPFRISPASPRLAQPIESTLVIVLVHLHNVIAYALFGMRMDRPVRLNLNFQQTLKKIESLSRRTRRSRPRPT